MGVFKMTGNKTVWEKHYSKVEDNLWGLNPIDTLVDYTSLVSKEGKVLDLGMGEGRNALYFASKGYSTVGIDISETAVNRCQRYATESGFIVEAKVENLIDYPLEENAYSLIILANVLNFFNDDEIELIIKKVKNGLIKGGLIYIDVFDVNDPGYKKHIVNCKMIKESTFYRPKSDSSIHFFTKNELDYFFDDFEPIKLSNTYLLDLSHGKPHYHSIIELLLKK